MNLVVRDASVALRAVYPNEEGHEDVIARLGEVVPAGIEPVAPDVFPYEVGISIRRGSGTGAERVTLMLDALQLVRLIRPSIEALGRAQASSAKLTFYDAAYVALAEDLGTIVWTEDQAILKAAPGVASDTRSIRQRLLV